MDVLVVGAGMAGLRVAALRAAAGDVVTVVDKGRRHGGRMATRRVDDATFDTGALDLASHGPAFAAALAGWAASGDVMHAPAPAPGGGPGEDRWRGRPTMRALPTALAQRSGAEVHLACTVTALAVREGRWQVTLQEGDRTRTATADALVLTCPAPQTLALLATGDGLVSEATRAALESVAYLPSLTVLARPADRTLTSEALTDPEPGALTGTDLVRVHRNDLTGASDPVALTLQPTTGFSTAHLDGDREEAARTLAAQASALVGAELEVVHVHGWRYAQAALGVALAALRDDTAGAPLVLAGDLFEAHGDAAPGVRPEGVERAFVSGGAGARLLDRS
jgi:predicted NAD/FAD-dependent oxidoreductase